ncbi:hypothetical protein KFL_003040140 [Klebsormidium nitens]|uniref:Uncharacterized protein n=1 Tax=Klebsormidium nitens TaxID=105231 RepID=A0A1Y1IEZ8_KLENI|nr:hypothetical protein KFL_003040140 [Klebsormidium nitens]|eukprot:GAQ86688.1 hypothetical protein KFL_003040140 [Klebsormidium nitens]
MQFCGTPAIPHYALTPANRSVDGEAYLGQKEQPSAQAAAQEPAPLFPRTVRASPIPSAASSATQPGGDSGMQPGGDSGMQPGPSAHMPKKQALPPFLPPIIPPDHPLCRRPANGEPYAEPEEPPELYKDGARYVTYADFPPKKPRGKYFKDKEDYKEYVDSFVGREMNFPEEMHQRARADGWKDAVEATCHTLAFG